MIYGYARVSTGGQSVAAQKEVLLAAGATKVFAETVSGAKTSRAQLTKCLKSLKEGDTLLVTRLDRLARSTRDLLNILAIYAATTVPARLMQRYSSTALQDPDVLTTYSHQQGTGPLISHVFGGFNTCRDTVP